MGRAARQSSQLEEEELFYGQSLESDSGQSEDSSDENDFVLSEKGSKEWRDKEGNLHRVAGPAVIHDDGKEEWYMHGKLHRIGGPAASKPDGRQAWYQEGLLHREDGPALVCPKEAVFSQGEVIERYYSHGTIHRDGGPAATYADGSKEWVFDGQLHRIGGPARTRTEEVSIKQGFPMEEYYENDVPHRDGAPAIIYAEGREEWWKNGHKHRDDGPAVVDPERASEWYNMNHLHREGGPAVSRSWHIATETGLPLEEWHSFGHLHRKDGPAIIYANGTEEWYQNGKTHREDGPAKVIGGSGEKMFACRGEQFPDSFRGRRAWKKAVRNTQGR